jgi:hypothetical protein
LATPRAWRVDRFRVFFKIKLRIRQYTLLSVYWLITLEFSLPRGREKTTLDERYSLPL